MWLPCQPSSWGADPAEEDAQVGLQRPPTMDTGTRGQSSNNDIVTAANRYRDFLWAQCALAINDHLPRPMLAASRRPGGSENLATGSRPALARR